MTAQTHKQFSITWVILGAMGLYTNGLTEINYYLALAIMLPMGAAGAIFPDLDHNWSSIGKGDKNALTWIINKLIHLTGGKHRSRHTHSIDVVVVLLIATAIIPEKLYGMGMIDNLNKEILYIVTLGFMLGWFSHIFSDMLTSGKVYLLCWGKIKVGFVPKSLLGLKFNTGDLWEEVVYRTSRVNNVIMMLMCLSFPYTKDIIIFKGGL